MSNAGRESEQRSDATKLQDEKELKKLQREYELFKMVNDLTKLDREFLNRNFLQIQSIADVFEKKERMKILLEVANLIDGVRTKAITQLAGEEELKAATKKVDDIVTPATEGKSRSLESIRDDLKGSSEHLSKLEEEPRNELYAQAVEAQIEIKKIEASEKLVKEVVKNEKQSTSSVTLDLPKKEDFGVDYRENPEKAILNLEEVHKKVMLLKDTSAESLSRLENYRSELSRLYVYFQNNFSKGKKNDAMRKRFGNIVSETSAKQKELIQESKAQKAEAALRAQNSMPGVSPKAPVVPPPRPPVRSDSEVPLSTQIAGRVKAAQTLLKSIINEDSPEKLGELREQVNSQLKGLQEWESTNKNLSKNSFESIQKKLLEAVKILDEKIQSYQVKAPEALGALTTFATKKHLVVDKDSQFIREKVNDIRKGIEMNILYESKRDATGKKEPTGDFKTALVALKELENRLEKAEKAIPLFKKVAQNRVLKQMKKMVTEQKSVFENATRNRAVTISPPVMNPQPKI